MSAASGAGSRTSQSPPSARPRGRTGRSGRSREGATRGRAAVGLFSRGQLDERAPRALPADHGETGGAEDGERRHRHDRGRAGGELPDRILSVAHDDDEEVASASERKPKAAAPRTPAAKSSVINRAPRRPCPCLRSRSGGGIGKATSRRPEPVLQRAERWRGSNGACRSSVRVKPRQRRGLPSGDHGDAPGRGRLGRLLRDRPSQAGKAARTAERAPLSNRTSNVAGSASRSRPRPASIGRCLDVGGSVNLWPARRGTRCCRWSVARCHAISERALDFAELGIAKLVHADQVTTLVAMTTIPRSALGGHGQE